MDLNGREVMLNYLIYFQVREFEEDADVVASKRQSANLTISVKSRLDLHPRAMKLSPKQVTVNAGGRGIVRKTAAMKPKKFANIGTLKSDGIKHNGKSVKSRLDMKKQNLSKNGSGSVFNRLNR